MGTLGSNGGERPPDGGQPDGLPGLPPEWGTIIIPEDPAELAPEADEIRRELRDATRKTRWRRLFGRDSGNSRPIIRMGADEPSLAVPLLIMAIAVAATLTSLFAVAWPRQPPTATPMAGLPGAAPDVTLVDPSGAQVRILDRAPAVIILVEGCDCGAFTAEVAADAPIGVGVYQVARSAPAKATPGVRPLIDTTDTLRTRLGLPPPAGQAAVALISKGGVLTRLVPRTRLVSDFRADLAAL